MVSGRFSLELPVGLESLKVSAWLTDSDPASRDPVDAHVSDPGEFTDGHAEIDVDLSASAPKLYVHDVPATDTVGRSGRGYRGVVPRTRIAGWSIALDDHAGSWCEGRPGLSRRMRAVQDEVH